MRNRKRRTKTALPESPKALPFPFQSVQLAGGADLVPGLEGVGLGEELSALHILALDAAQQDANVVAGLGVTVGSEWFSRMRMRQQHDG